MTVSLTDLTKRYGATTALENVSLTIKSGTVHALLGHNGAGKSTLIKCLGGSIRPSSGTIRLNGSTLAHLSPRSAIDAGISIIYQHLGLIDHLTVAENMFLGTELTSGPFVKSRKQVAIAAKSLARIGSRIDPSTPIAELSSGQRQMVAIAKAIQRDAQLLVLDEPTAALSPVEARALGALVGRLRSEGLAILYVTHLLNEVMALADEVTVLRNGQAVWASDMRTVEKADLVRVISESSDTAPRDTHVIDRSGKPALAVTSIDTRADVDSLGAEKSTSLPIEVYPGEIVGLYGLIGSGRTRLLESLYGARTDSRVQFELNGLGATAQAPRDALAKGIALVPADRHKQGLFLSLPAQENTVTSVMSLLSRTGFRHVARERDVFNDVANLMSLRPHNGSLAADRFSGGNQQKLLISRWVNQASKAQVLLVDDPTQGVDVGARGEIYRVLRQLARLKGMGILFSTNEPEEIMALADRCAVIERGRVSQVIDVSDTNAEILLSTIHPTNTRPTPYSEGQLV
ncbi:sugar ABC transporter ATP-binding protein [Arthrobacter sp. M4]|uniref:sugar ABC transporter ATP-binding protein n=1 Tax=Arthrobacter sp. M4 TaxID=218160 RepID=UPI001CDB81A8|nr:sugar ABC transporter ATP-binding protein [Arthrobacter sp. M4]MCA4132556.1 sugar ABC transporter ATP-binding protein [Arthrobacter sp. M4]